MMFLTPSNEPNVRVSQQPCAHKEVVVVGGAAPHGRPQVTTQEGQHVGRAGERRKTWVEEGEIMDGLRNRGSSGVWHHEGLEYRPALNPGVCYSTVCIEGCRFMSAWLKEEEKAPENRQRKKEAKEVDKIEVTPGKTVASMRRFKAALTGPTQGPP